MNVDSKTMILFDPHEAPITLGEFFEANTDGIDEAEQAQIKAALAKGDAYYGGGGAAADFTISHAEFECDAFKMLADKDSEGQSLWSFIAKQGERRLMVEISDAKTAMRVAKRIAETVGDEDVPIIDREAYMAFWSGRPVNDFDAAMIDTLMWHRGWFTGHRDAFAMGVRQAYEDTQEETFLENPFPQFHGSWEAWGEGYEAENI